MSQALINTIMQIGVVLIVAFVVWLIFGRKTASFPRYIGLTLPPARAMSAALAFALVFSALSMGLLFYFPLLKEMAAGPNTVAGAIREMGATPETYVVIAITAFLKTALAEEILFRGLIAKRLIAILGFWPGNAIHAAAFAAMHLLVFVAPGGPAFSWTLAGPMLALIFVTSTVMVWLNEKRAGGSIGPSWLIHAVGNAVAYPVLAFT
jgi:membrane protease YdiL (CAAX protease family)